MTFTASPIAAEKITRVEEAPDNESLILHLEGGCTFAVHRSWWIDATAGLDGPYILVTWLDHVRQVWSEPDWDKVMKLDKGPADDEANEPVDYDKPPKQAALGDPEE